ncbi:MAG: NAD-dependent epimerase/dehydratase family protein, partial [Thermodesulfobacteriota bacterium]|nr:NAD-dependent epimerase/dehydratase family protein [Thermodesulfobacteriota bacterium]
KLVIEANGKGALLTTSLRPHLIWGPDDPHLMPRLIQKAKDGKLLKIGEGKNRIDTIYVENAAAAHLLAADHLYPGSPVAGQCYFISDGKPVVLWDFISQVLKKLEIPPIKRSVSYNTAKIIGLFLEIFHRILNLKKEPVMTRLLAAQLATSHFFDISRARRDFGYNPIINIEEGLERLLSGIMERTG